MSARIHILNFIRNTKIKSFLKFGTKLNPLSMNKLIIGFRFFAGTILLIAVSNYNNSNRITFNLNDSSLNNVILSYKNLKLWLTLWTDRLRDWLRLMSKVYFEKISNAHNQMSILSTVKMKNLIYRIRNAKKRIKFFSLFYSLWRFVTDEWNA